jgi:hypothetical protein
LSSGDADQMPPMEVEAAKRLIRLVLFPQQIFFCHFPP